MTDTEKKIAEIREGYKSERDDNFTYKKEIVEQDIRFLLSELERKDEIIEEQKRELFYKSKEITELREKSWQDQQWFRKLREERETLIECLLFYERLARCREVNDGGRRARTLLAEIGVTVK